jgi:hypothetical protein
MTMTRDERKMSEATITEFAIYGEEESTEATPPHGIFVGNWKTHYPPSGQGAVYKGVHLVAFGRQGQELARETLGGHSRWLPEATNQLGRPGAVTVDPPTDAEIEAATERMRRVLMAEEKALSTAPPLRAGWSEWVYIPYQRPDHDDGGRVSKIATDLGNYYQGPETDDAEGDHYQVIGHSRFWNIKTEAVRGAGSALYYENPLFASAEEAMIAAERARQEDLHR